jgi:hypothetical protein
MKAAYFSKSLVSIYIRHNMHGYVVRSGTIYSFEIVAMRRYRSIYWTDRDTLTGWLADVLGQEIPDWL